MRCFFPRSRRLISLLGRRQLLIVDGGAVDRLQANDIKDSLDLVLAQVCSIDQQRTRHGGCRYNV